MRQALHATGVIDPTPYNPPIQWLVHMGDNPRRYLPALTEAARGFGRQTGGSCIGGPKWFLSSTTGGTLVELKERRLGRRRREGKLAVVKLGNGTTVTTVVADGTPEASVLARVRWRALFLRLRDRRQNANRAWWELLEHAMETLHKQHQAEIMKAWRTPAVLAGIRRAADRARSRIRNRAATRAQVLEWIETEHAHAVACVQTMPCVCGGSVWW